MKEPAMRKEFIAKPYQDILVDHFIEHERCAGWAGMGMGKTSSALTAIDRLIMMGDDKPTLVLAPLLVARTTWPEEARKWNHLRHIDVVPIVGTEFERVCAINRDASVYTTNYENLPWLVEHLGDRWPFDKVIADESTRLKNFRLRQGGVRAKALAQVAHTKIKRFIELTGTPSPNGLMDLWGQLWMLDKGLRLGRSFSAFKERWFKAIKKGEFMHYEPQEHASREIHKVIGDLCLTVNAKDWFDLREPIVVNKYVELPIRARKAYVDMEVKFYLELEQHFAEAVNSAAKSQKLLQLANGAVYVDPLTEDDNDPRARLYKEVHDAKLQMLESIVNEASGAPVLVAYNFKSDLARLQKAFPKAVALNPGNVQEVMKQWNAGKIDMLLVHPASAGHGLNLQDGGNILVFFGLNWNLEQRLQVIERIGPVRQLQAGHDRPVFIYNILARDTIDELVLDRVETKREVQDLLLEAMAKKRRRVA
jgi:SNF2 family DNA or RNA helicase